MMPLIKIEETDKVVIVARDYDGEKRLTGARFADEDRTHLTPQAAYLIEAYLMRLGWARLEKQSCVDRRGAGHTSYSVFFCPDFLGRLAPPLDRKSDGTLCARERAC
jgi:hypothetical protein